MCEWLKHLNLQNYIENFRIHAVNGNTLMELTADKLDHMGVKVCLVWRGLSCGVAINVRSPPIMILMIRSGRS